MLNSHDNQIETKNNVFLAIHIVDNERNATPLKTIRTNIRIIVLCSNCTCKNRSRKLHTTKAKKNYYMIPPTYELIMRNERAP